MRLLSGNAAQNVVDRLELRRTTPASRDVERSVAMIIKDVRRSGDKGLRRYATRFDDLDSRTPLRVSGEEMEASLSRISPDLLRALKAAARNIRRFCEWQKPRPFFRAIGPGIKVGQLVRPLASVGCYVPGGRYPLPSSMLMTVIPAQVAGVQRIVVVSPRTCDVTFAAAALLGVTEYYRIGGAHAIAALAYGTQSIPPVAKIVGPGNVYVTTAKRLVAFDCSIDMLAGPTEVLILSTHGEPSFIAADLAAQAEHDPDALPIFITTGAKLAQDVVSAVRKAAAVNKAAAPALKQGVALVAQSNEQAVDWSNRIAPEHITVPPEFVPRISCAGSIFVGEYSPQAMGDYASGPNHVLPTGGAARFRGGLSVTDFVKLITVQQASREGLEAIEPVVTTLASAEGLQAHAASVRVRCAHA